VEEDILSDKTVFYHSIRFDVLAWRCRVAALEEGLKMATFIQSLQDPSGQIELIAKALLLDISARGLRSAASMQESIRTCSSLNLPFLEIEFRSLQIMSRLVARQADSSSSLELSEDDLKAVLDLCRRFPDAPPVPQNTVNNLSHDFLAQKPLDCLFCQIRMSKPAHLAGHLDRCTNDHLYSAKTYGACPECCPEVVVREPVKQVDPNTFLKNDAFLDWARRKSGMK
jgi:hypothetical protein